MAIVLSVLYGQLVNLHFESNAALMRTFSVRAPIARELQYPAMTLSFSPCDVTKPAGMHADRIRSCSIGGGNTARCSGAPDSAPPSEID
jgi:hypothetical protein